VLDDRLVEEAFKLVKDIKTKRELVERALIEFVQRRKMKNLKDIKGKISFHESYDYKSLREEK